jgi:GntR family transcriptional repressor for pyruvate dehydrogenase complex
VARSDSDGFVVQQVLRPREQVQKQIEDAIFNGTFAQGEKLPSENALAVMFGVSRPTVREALGNLVTAGLVRKIPGASGGSFVREIDAKAVGQMLQDSLSHVLQLGSINIEEVSQAREVLEVPSARLAARHRTPEQVKAARDVVEQQKSIELSSPKVSILDQQFHQIIAEASGNRLLVAIVEALHACTAPVTYLQLTPEVGHNTILQHAQIIKGVEAGDEAAAADAMHEHLSYVRQMSRDFPAEDK